MAHSLEWEEEQMAALAGTLEGLNVDDDSCAGASLTIPENLETLNGNSMDVGLFEAPPIIGSDKLHLRKFTLVTQPQLPGAGAASHCHVIVHVEGASLFVASNSEEFAEDEMAMIPKLEMIKVSTIGDKFPIFDLKGLTAGNTFLIKSWADLNTCDEPAYPVQYLANIQLQSSMLMSISITTRICTFGKLVAEKSERLHSYSTSVNQVTYSAGSFVCELILSFIEKLKSCGPIKIVNDVLENFTVVQIISDDVTKEILMCLAYVFEICSPQQSATSGASYKVFRLDTAGFKPDPPNPSHSHNTHHAVQ